MYTYATYSEGLLKEAITYSPVAYHNHGTVHSILSQRLSDSEWVQSYKTTWMHRLTQAGIFSLLSKSADDVLEAQ